MRTMLSGIPGRRLLVALLALSLAACSAQPPASGQRPTPTLPQFSTTPPKPRAERTLPDSCGKVLTRADLDQTLESTLTGRTEVVVGVALPSIGRTGRIDCYYGIPEGQPNAAAPLIVGLAGYTDAAKAGERIQGTIDTERDKGTKPVEVAVGAGKGTLLDGADHTLIAAHGKITVAVTAKPTLVTAERAAEVLGKLADLALTER
ncbi:hypothetical protein [Actinokineospora enzanensis]|uniref:hypothetical protein n=1 Tax=Actinokineospora enzanensis TaxID=155975 RepID=UPI00036325B7|nr:hypothetical protein [Actinokineospora enzanensis]